MSKNDILPEGMYWHYNPMNKKFSIIMDKDCDYRNVQVVKE